MRRIAILSNGIMIERPNISSFKKFPKHRGCRYAC